MTKLTIGPVGSQPLLLRYANRHGLVAGATGTGKTVTLQTMAEGFSKAGVPVFIADAKGDLSGMCVKRTLPVALWDVYAKDGTPIRLTVESMGSELLAQLMGVSPVQEGVLAIAFAVSEAEGLPLYTMEDLRSLLAFISENHKQITQRYGNVTPASVGAIRRRLLTLTESGVDHLFGGPAIDVADLLVPGQVNILAAERLMRNPAVYAMFLLWLLKHLFETLPEVGDGDKPKLVFFFDEAHMLFSEASPLVLKTVERVVRLIRSKGVGVYFVTQSPDDIPAAVLAQLGNRVQHALRAFTGKDHRAIVSAAQTYRSNPDFITSVVMQSLGVGEALVSFLDDTASPRMVERVKVRLPACHTSRPATSHERALTMERTGYADKYALQVWPGADAKLHAMAGGGAQHSDALLDAIRAVKNM